MVAPLDVQEGEGDRPFPEVGLDDVAAAGVLDQAVHFAESTTHADVFQHLNSPDGGPGSIAANCAAQGVPPSAKNRLGQGTATGNRLPLSY